MSSRTGMCPHCGRIVRITKGGLTYRHLSDDEHGRTIVPCPGARQNPRCAESDARLLWNGQLNPHIGGCAVIPALGVNEPYASAIVHGLKRWETRGQPPNGEMRPDGVRGLPGVRLARGGRVMVIANAARPEGEWFGEYMLGQWTDDEVRHVGGVHPDECELCPDPGDGLMDPACVALNDLRPALLNDEGAHGVSLAMYLHPGHIVGSVTVTDALPIVADCDDLPDAPPLIETLGEPLRMWPEGAMDLSESVDISDQLPWGDWRPGRWAWQLADPKTTNEMCPVCEGMGVVPPRDPMNPDMTSFGKSWDRCPFCDDFGMCDPIPVRGHQGLRPLTPEQFR